MADDKGNPFGKEEAAEPPAAAATAVCEPVPSPVAVNDFFCPFVDLDTQNALASRLLGCLAHQTVLQKRKGEEGVSRLRQMLLPEDKDRKKKGGLTLVALDERLRKTEEKAASTSIGNEGFTTALFTSKDELQRRHATALHALDAGEFRHSKRAALAAELLRAWDAAQTVHCGEVLVPGTEAAERHQLCCAFRPVPCSNEGCLEYFSIKLEKAHDLRCPFKLLPCSRGCGAQEQRQNLAAHEDGPCLLKPVTCPLAHLGCQVPGLTQGSLQEHLTEAAGAHAVLLAASVGAHGQALTALAAAHAEAQSQLETLRGKLAASEAEAAELREAVEAAVRQLRQADEARAKEVAALRAEVQRALKGGAQGGGGGGAEIKRLDAAVAEARKAHERVAREQGEQRAAIVSIQGEHARLAQAVNQVVGGGRR